MRVNRILLTGGVTIATLIAITACDNHILLREFLEKSTPKVVIANTFGQLVKTSPVETAHYITLRLDPTNGRVRIPSTGSVRLYDTLDGLTDCLVLKPKLRPNESATSFEGIDSDLPKPDKLRLCFCNLDDVTLNASGHTLLMAGIADIYENNRVTDPLNAAQNYLNTPEADRGVLGVRAPLESTLMPGDTLVDGQYRWSELPAAKDGNLQFAVYYEVDGDRRYVNPEPYLASIRIIDDTTAATDAADPPFTPPAAMFRQPDIADISLEMAPDANFTSITPSLLMTNGAINPAGAAISGHMRLFFHLTEPAVDTDPPLVVPYEIKYELRDALTGTVRSHAIYHLNKYPTDTTHSLTMLSQQVGAALYRVPGLGAPESSLTTQTLWMYVPLNGAEVAAGDSAPLFNAADPDQITVSPGGLVKSLDLSSIKADGSLQFPPGNYDFQIWIADAFHLSSPRTYTVQFEIRVDPSTFTVALNTDSDNNGAIDPAADDAVEDAAPGKVLCLNDNDDNSDGAEDRTEALATAGETDLVELALNTTAIGADIRWKLRFPDAIINIWHNNDRSDGAAAPIVHDALRPLPIPAQLWVEGLAQSAASGDVTVELVLEDGSGGNIHDDEVKLTVVDLAIVNPTGPTLVGGVNEIMTPAPSPAFAGNEFTYSTATPGILTIPVYVTVLPDSADIRAVFTNKLRFQLDMVDDSHASPVGGNVQLAWDNAFAADVTAGNGVYNVANARWEATASFTTLPPDHDDFGPKKLTVAVVDGTTSHCTTTRTYEVFWPFLKATGLPRTDLNFAKNHPGPNLAATAAETGDLRLASSRAPNWFYYWRLVVGGAAMFARWDSTDPAYFGECPAVYSFNRAAAPGPYTGLHRVILIEELAQGQDTTGGITTGIDAFFDTVRHESHHAIDQTVGYTNTAFGLGITGATAVANAHWSFRIAKPGVTPPSPLPPGRVYNHYVNLNADADFTDAGEDLDTDGDGLINAVDVPIALAFEDPAEAAESNLNHVLAQYDWGNPGKNHATNNNYAD